MNTLCGPVEAPAASFLGSMAHQQAWITIGAAGARRYAAAAAPPACRPTAPAPARGDALLCCAATPRRRLQKAPGTGGVDSSGSKLAPDVAMPVLAQAPAAAAAVAAPVPLDQQIVALKALGEQLGALATYADKIELLQREPAVRAFFKTR